jgi:hypothetical protein
VRHPRQACDHHAKGHPVGPSYSWRESLNYLLLIKKNTRSFSRPFKFYIDTLVIL